MKEEFKRIHKKINQDLPKGPIYHYTDLNALESILHHKKLRFTDYKYLNDPTEINYGRQLMSSVLNQFTDKRLNYVKDYLEKTFASHKLINMYISCFSSEIDKLSLWRYYADNGSGIAIGFRREFYDLESDGTFRKPVIYKINYQQSEIENIFKQFIQKYLECGGNQYDDLIANLVSILPMFKDNSFQDEHEVRLVLFEGEFAIDPSTNKPFYFDERDKSHIPASQKRFVKKHYDTKPVVNLRFSDEDIFEIRIGPACDFIQAKNHIEKLLKKYHSEPENVILSQCMLPFRD